MLIDFGGIRHAVGRPLYRGRELKCNGCAHCRWLYRRPLYRGRELKYQGNHVIKLTDKSPSV